MFRFGLILTAILVLVSCKEEVPREDLHFFVAGNVAGNPDVQGDPFHPPFTQFLSQAKQDTTLDFGVFVSTIVPESSNANWQAVDGSITKFGRPIYFAPGVSDLNDRSLYTSRYGDPDHSFEQGRNHFQFWDVSKNGWNILPKKVDKLISDVTTSNPDNVFIFVNHMIWHDSVTTPGIKPNSLEGRNETQYQSFYHTVLSKLAKLKQPVYIFAGDVGLNAGEGNTGIHQFKNVHFIATGLGSGEWESVMQVNITDGKAHVEVDYLDPDQANITIDTLYNKIW